MDKFEHRMPTDAEMAAIRAHAHRLRAEATRDMAKAVAGWFRRLFGAASAKPAGWRSGVN